MTEDPTLAQAIERVSARGPRGPGVIYDEFRLVLGAAQRSQVLCDLLNALTNALINDADPEHVARLVNAAREELDR